MKNIYLKNTVVLLCIAVVVAVLLFFTNFYTKNTVAENNANNQANALQDVISNLSITSQENAGNLWTYYNGNSIIGYAVLSSGQGLGGEIDLIIGMDSNYKILKVDIVSQKETPWVNLNTMKKTLSEFANQTGPFTVSLNPASSNEIKEITGDKETTNALVNIVNNAILLVESQGETNGQ